MKLLITGGTGLLGRALIRLASQHYDVYFTAREATAAQPIADAYGATPRIVDIHNHEALESVCAGMDWVIHSAAMSSPWGAFESFYQTNVAATQALCLAAYKSGVQSLIHISSTSVYFDFSDRWDMTEKEPVAGRWCNAYAETKYLSEQVVASSPVHSVILRPRGIFGPHDRAIVPRVLKAVRGNHLLLPSARNPVVDITYVDNVAKAALLACQRAASLSNGEIFNISNNQPLPTETILKMLLSGLGKPVSVSCLPYAAVQPLLTANEWVRAKLPHRPEPRITRYSAGLFHYHQTLSTEKARTQLGYEPTISIQQGVQAYANWYQNPTV